MGLSEERVLLLTHWLECDPKNKKEINLMKPKRVKKRRPIEGSAPSTEEAEGWEEYYAWLFPDDAEAEEKAKSLKLVEMAHQWKQQQ